MGRDKLVQLLHSTPANQLSWMSINCVLQWLIFTASFFINTRSNIVLLAGAVLLSLLYGRDWILARSGSKKIEFCTCTRIISYQDDKTQSQVTKANIYNKFKIFLWGKLMTPNSAQLLCYGTRIMEITQRIHELKCNSKQNTNANKKER